MEPLPGLVTMCPERFKEDQIVFKWVGRELLGTETPKLVTEVPFLKGSRVKEDGKQSRDNKGRIDVVLMNESIQNGRWCCLEAQAVCFSGEKMELDFKQMRNWQGPGIPYPTAVRRPDWRSSSAKRLLPQLQAKVPAISRWGVKMAVVVDAEFRRSLGEIKTERRDFKQ